MTTDELNFFSASAKLAACTELDIPAMELLYRLEGIPGARSVSLSAPTPAMWRGRWGTAPWQRP